MKFLSINSLVYIFDIIRQVKITTFKGLLKYKSAWVPLAMSAAALMEIVIYVALNGFKIPPQQADENLPAHIFQLLLVGQIPFIAYFSVINLSKYPKEVVKILILQFLSGLVPFTLISLLEM